MDRWTMSTLALALVGGETTFKGKKVALKDAPRTQWTGHDPVRPVGDAIAIDGFKFPASVKDGQLHVSTVPDGAPSTGVTAASTPSFTWTADDAKREVQLRFSSDAQGVWRYRAENAWEYKVGGETLRLVDTDANGRFDAFGVDGVTTYDSPLVLPLVKEFNLGASHVEVASISPDGSTLVATVTPIKAGKSELAALVRINQWRAAAGLPPVSYDPTLCEHCSAHAEYLRRHNWDGWTDPHQEEAGSDGATPGGKLAAESSVIGRGPVSTTLDRFLDTYYHRIPFMAPALERIGINDKPEDITVIDVHEGVHKMWPKAAGWSCPVFSPAPGARDVPTAAVGEQPHEPVAAFDTRGLPLMVLFDFTHHTGVPGFAGKLYQRKGNKEVEVATLPADPWQWASCQGIVPAAKLAAKSQYRAVFTWIDHEKIATQVVDFTTR
jgi:hypothetical protein